MKGLSINYKWVREGMLCAGLAGIGLVVFLSLRSSPALTTVKWMPRTIANWADRHGRFCNFPAYGLVALPFFFIATTTRQKAWTFALLALLIASLEICQLAIPARYCDIWDIVWGCAGLLTAWVICDALKKFMLVIRSISNPVS